MANPIDGKNGSHAIALVVVAEEEVEGTWVGGQVRGEVSRKEPWAAVAFLIDSHAKSLQRMRSLLLAHLSIVEYNSNSSSFSS